MIQSVEGALRAAVETMLEFGRVGFAGELREGVHLGGDRAHAGAGVVRVAVVGHELRELVLAQEVLGRARVDLVRRRHLKTRVLSEGEDRD